MNNKEIKKEIDPVSVLEKAPAETQAEKSVETEPEMTEERLTEIATEAMSEIGTESKKVTTSVDERIEKAESSIGLSPEKEKEIYEKGGFAEKIDAIKKGISQLAEFVKDSVSGLFVKKIERKQMSEKELKIWQEKRMKEWEEKKRKEREEELKAEELRKKAEKDQEEKESREKPIRGAGILDIEKFNNLPVLGKPLEMDRNEKVIEGQPIDFDNIAVVRLFKSFNGPNFETPPDYIESSFGRSSGTDLRETVHFTLNHPVEGHSMGSWSDAEAAVIIPFKDMVEVNGLPKNFLSEDTYWRAEKLSIPPSAIWLHKGKENSGTPKNLRENQHFIKTAENKEIHQAVVVVLERMGFTSIKERKIFGSRLDAVMSEFKEKYNLVGEQHDLTIDNRVLDRVNIYELFLKDEWRNAENRWDKLGGFLGEGVGSLPEALNLLDPEKRGRVLSAFKKVLALTPQNLISPEKLEPRSYQFALEFYRKLDEWMLDLERLINKEENKPEIFDENSQKRKEELINFIKLLDQGTIETYFNQFYPLKNYLESYFRKNREEEFFYGVDDVKYAIELLKERGSTEVNTYFSEHPQLKKDQEHKMELMNKFRSM